MDLFPDGSFVRLRSRARDKYVHADGEDDSVSLRPLGDARSMTTVRKVYLRPVEGEGGDNVRDVLLKGAAYGRYLAVAPADEFPPSGHRGVRAVQRDYNSVDLDPAFVWTPYRVEAGQKYVRLHNNEQRCLRANGGHRYLKNIVTVEAINGNETTMMQWRVEAIPLSPAPLPLSPPPPVGYCCGCGREGSTPLCCLCAAHMKTKLRDAKKSLLNIERAQKQSYCLKCKQFFTAIHTEHDGMTIPVGRYKNRPVAWVTGDETWSRIFESIESPHRGIKPYQLYESRDPRCRVCGDTVSGDGLYGTLIEFCSLPCFVARGGSEEMAVEKALVTMNSSDSSIGFCMSCATPIISSGGGNTHAAHDWVRVHANSVGLWVIVPHQHPKEQTWATVKEEGNRVLVRDVSSVLRCNRCHKRLASAGDSCSLQCWLDAPGRKAELLPRAL